MAIQENGTEDASLGLKRAAADGDTDIDQQTNGKVVQPCNQFVMLQKE